MVYHDPQTYVPGQGLAAADLNRDVRDNVNALAKSRVLAVSFGDPSGGVIPTGLRGYLEVPFDCVVVAWTILGTPSGSIVIDVWRDSYANFPPTVADSIAGSEKPTLSSAQKNQDLSLSTWSPDIAAGDVLGFNVDSVSGVKQVSLILRLEMVEP